MLSYIIKIYMDFRRLLPNGIISTNANVKSLDVKIRQMSRGEKLKLLCLLFLCQT